MITFQFTGKAVKAMILSLGRQLIIHIPALFLLNNLLGFNGFIWNHPIADILITVVAVMMILLFFREMEDHHDRQLKNFSS